MSVSTVKSTWCETWFNTAEHVYFDRAVTLEGWWWRFGVCCRVFSLLSYNSRLYSSSAVGIHRTCNEHSDLQSLFPKCLSAEIKSPLQMHRIYRRPTIWNFAAVFLNRMHSRNFVFHERKILLFFCEFFKYFLKSLENFGSTDQTGYFPGSEKYDTPRVIAENTL